MVSAIILCVHGFLLALDPTQCCSNAFVNKIALVVLEESGVKRMLEIFRLIHNAYITSIKLD
jgi:hypothetical protein